MANGTSNFKVENVVGSQCEFDNPGLGCSESE